MGDFGRNNETRCSEESRYLYGKIILGTWQSRYSKDLAIAELAIARFYCTTTTTSTVAVVKCMRQHARLFHEKGQATNNMAPPFGQVDRLTPLEGSITPGCEWP